MRDQQHREIGRILGFPSCCVEAWIRDPLRLNRRNGGFTERLRTPSEAARLDAEVSEMLGRPWPGVSRDLRKHWVLCDDCAARKAAA